MEERLQTIINHYEDINKQLTDVSIISDANKLRELTKKASSLEETVIKAKEYLNIEYQLEEIKLIINDEELGPIAKEEQKELIAKKEELVKEIEILLIPNDPNDDKDVIVEIRGAAGGDEANIFAGDLFRMYQRYFEKHNFKIEILNSMDGNAGGFSQIEFMVTGNKVYSKLKYESGSHRVQRIPTTESNGRLQTSTATVLVMPKAEEVDIVIEEKDLKIDTYRASGAGGQHVNTTDSAVRITHIPTGISVASQQDRSQLKNREKALSMLKTRLYEEERLKNEQEQGTTRRQKIGTGDRAEKIRTYNYPQNRVTDHRINYTSKNLNKIIDGDLDELIDSLMHADQKLKLQEETIES